MILTPCGLVKGLFLTVQVRFNIPGHLFGAIIFCVPTLRNCMYTWNIIYLFIIILLLQIVGHMESWEIHPLILIPFA